MMRWVYGGLLLLAAGAPPSLAATPIALGSYASLHSEILGEDRDLLIYLPNGYEEYQGGERSAPDQRYPVLYLLDGRVNFKFTAGLVHNLAEAGHLPRMIVIGVANHDRWRDLTPSADPSHAGTGGGERFVRFLTEELIPWVDGSFRTTPYRILAGHSLGGLTVLDATIRAPGTFDAALALSPSLEWNGESLVERWREFLAGREELELDLFLFLGNERVERPGFFAVVSELERNRPAGLEWTHRLDERDDHSMARFTGTLSGLRWVYRDWSLTYEDILLMSDEAILRHFERAGRRYEQERRPDLYTLVEAGYFGLGSERTRERAFEVMRLAIELFPDRPYPHDGLGELYERTGRLPEALEKYRQATALAREMEHPNLEYFEGHLTGLSQRLGRTEPDALPTDAGREPPQQPPETPAAKPSPPS